MLPTIQVQTKIGRQNRSIFCLIVSYKESALNEARFCWAIQNKADSGIIKSKKISVVFNKLIFVNFFMINHVKICISYNTMLFNKEKFHLAEH